MSQCPCGSTLNYDQCCRPFHKKEQNAPTAEKLMRARYCAFEKSEIGYIADTHIPGTTDFDKDEATEWANTSDWKGLEIVRTQDGQEDDNEGLVEFKATYTDKNKKDIIHHEVSVFKKIDGNWFYENGQIIGTGPLVRQGPKIGRNEPCPCGSGKKYKKCCALK